MPLPQIVQPLLWAYAFDALSICPTPDYLVLADECEYYQYDVENEMQVKFGQTGDVDMVADDEEQREMCRVSNPGSFATDQTFTVIYPTENIVQRS